MRDLENDLKLIETVIKEPWQYCYETSYYDVAGKHLCAKSHKVKIGEELLTIDYDPSQHPAGSLKARFIAEATKGWPEAIKRAIAAEKERDDIQASMLAAQEYEDGVRKKYHLSPDTSFGDLAKMETQREGRMLEL